MARYDDAFVDRFLEPWNRHDVDGPLSLMTGDCVWEVREAMSRMAPSPHRAGGRSLTERLAPATPPPTGPGAELNFPAAKRRPPCTTQQSTSAARR